MNSPHIKITPDNINDLVNAINKYLNGFESKSASNNGELIFSTNFSYDVTLSLCQKYDEVNIQKIVIPQLNEELKDYSAQNISKHLKKCLMRGNAFSSLGTPLWKMREIKNLTSLQPLDVIYNYTYSIMVGNNNIGKTTYVKQLIKKFIERYNSADKPNDTSLSEINYFFERSTYNDYLINFKNKIIPFYIDLLELYNNDLSLKIYLQNKLEVKFTDFSTSLSNYGVVIFVDGIDDLPKQDNVNNKNTRIEKLIDEIEELFNFKKNKNRNLVIVSRNLAIHHTINGKKFVKFNLLPMNQDDRKKFILSYLQNNNYSVDINNKVINLIEKLEIDKELLTKPRLILVLVEYCIREKEKFNNFFAISKMIEKIIEETKNLLDEQCKCGNIFTTELIMDILSDIAYSCLHFNSISEYIYLGIITQKFLENKINLEYIKNFKDVIEVHSEIIVQRKKGTYEVRYLDFLNFLSAYYISKLTTEKLCEKIWEYSQNLRKYKKLILNIFYLKNNDSHQLIINYLLGFDKSQNDLRIIPLNNIYFSTLLYNINPKSIQDRDLPVFKELLKNFIMKHECSLHNIVFNNHNEPTLKMRIEVATIMGLRKLDDRQGVTFEDDYELPLVNIDKGSFMYGLNEWQCSNISKDLDAERETRYIGKKCEIVPQKVDIEKSFKISKYVVTVALYKKFVLDNGYNYNIDKHEIQNDYWDFSEYSKKWICNLVSETFVKTNEICKKENNSEKDFFRKQYNKFLLPLDFDILPDNSPMVNISFIEAVAFTRWLSKKTGKKYRLPYEWEWEYVSRRMYNEKIKLNIVLNDKYNNIKQDDFDISIVDFQSQDKNNFPFTKDDFAVNDDKTILFYDDKMNIFDPNIPVKLYNTRQSNSILTVTLNKGIPSNLENIYLTLEVSFLGEKYTLVFGTQGLIKEKSNYNDQIFVNISLESGEKYHKYNWGNYFNSSYCICNYFMEHPIPVGIIDSENEIFDLNGNVWELCMSSFDENVEYHFPSDYRNNDIDLSKCCKEMRMVVRGGSYQNSKILVRNTFRGRDLIGDRILGFRHGFRVVCED